MHQFTDSPRIAHLTVETMELEFDQPPSVGGCPVTGVPEPGGGGEGLEGVAVEGVALLRQKQENP